MQATPTFRPDLLAALRGMEEYEAAIKRIVDAAPPLSDAQRDKLGALLDDTAALELRGSAA